MLSRVRKVSHLDDFNEYDTYRLEDDDNETIQYMLKMKKSEDLTYKYDPFFDTRSQFVFRGQSRRKMCAVHTLSLKIKRDNKVSNITLKINVEKYVVSDWESLAVIDATEHTFFFHQNNLKYFILSFFGRLCKIEKYYVTKHKKIENDIYSFNIEATIELLPIAYKVGDRIHIVKEGDKIGDIKNKDELTLLSADFSTFILCDKNDDALRIYKNINKIKMLHLNTVEGDFNLNLDRGHIPNIPLDYQGSERFIMLTEKLGYVYYNYDYNVNPLAQIFLYSEKGNNVNIILNDENLSSKLFNDNQVEKVNRLTILCRYYTIRKFHMLDVPDFDYYEASHVLPGFIRDPHFKKMLEEIEAFGVELISILAVVFLDNEGPVLATYIKNIYYNLLYLITDDYRNRNNVLYDLIVNWYKNSKDWDDLARQVGFYSPFKTLNGNYKAINLLIYSIGQYFPYLNRENYIPNFNLDDFINRININNWEYEISILSDFEIISLFDNVKYKRKLDQLFFENSPGIKPIGKYYIKQVFSDFIKNRSIWSIYRKKKCLNDKVMNIMMGTTHAEDDKEGNLLSYGYLKYDCYIMEDLWEVWRIPGNLEQKGFINPDYLDPEMARKLGNEVGNNNKELFSLADIKSLIKYLKEDIEKEDNPKYTEFVKFLEDNIYYANADDSDIAKNRKLLNKINQDIVLYFFSMTLCLIMKVRYWGVVNWSIPYSKQTISNNDNSGRGGLRDNMVRTFFEDVMYPWLIERSKEELNVLINMINIQPTYLNAKEFSKYKPDRREGITKVPKNISDMSKFLDSLTVSPTFDRCKIIEYDKNTDIYNVKKNTIFGRIIHGLFQEGSCFGVNGDLLIDNLKIYNELYFKHNIDDYNVILTENVKEIIPGKIGRNEIIDIMKFEYTHPRSNVFERNPRLEENY